MESLKRTWFEIFVTLVVTGLFLTRAYELAPNATQLILLKINLVSMGFLHAHVVGKLLFKTKLEWIASRHCLYSYDDSFNRSVRWLSSKIV